MNFTNIKTYADLAETCGALILCNGMGDLELELINGEPAPAMNFTNIKTYADLAETCGALILCNGMGDLELELINGEPAPWDEVFQWYIVDDPTFLLQHTDELVFYYEPVFQWYIVDDPTFLLQHTDELVFYYEPLDLHVLGVTHFGTDWAYVAAPELH